MSSHSLNNVHAKPKPAVIRTTNKGVLTALGAFLIWGSFPFYFKQLGEYNAIEIIGHRIVWTFVCLTIVLVIGKRWQWVTTLKNNPHLIWITFVSGLIIACNWLTYVWAVNANQVLEASLGYFISPLVGIMLSLVFLKERLRPLQWIAVAFALSSVLIQVVMLGKLPIVSLVLALSFSVYGVMQRRTPLQALDALFLETALLLPLCIWWFLQADVASANIEFWWSSEIWFLMLAGPITLVPLLLFNKSTKMVAYSILSFMNYLTPTMIFCLAVFYYHEPFDTKRLMIFGLIWIGLALFSIDLWQNRPSKVLKQLQKKQKNGEL
ncbi:EamA family transporter RarD [Psychrobacter sp. FDAARGOS_221]|uniref:EamA family transporter RarD n=1 Tax=Psychrobacter sp. FDAARGOS_221 TaxID=1975705 RepID=UPI000BB55CD0|nr:EamA family transporter RarD [Psychrobacter sp. FDAARGOS_221]PNK59532.1 EamA family transporter RarD [Psychrobacter sp. FDAARGOS_221]